MTNSRTILEGIDVDILRDGSLDLPDSSMAKLDVVVAAVHSHFDLPRRAQTGRLIGEREPYEIDIWIA